MFWDAKLGEQKIRLADVSWEQFQQLLAELRLERKTRLAYYRKRLELTTLKPEHHRLAHLIESLVLVLADERSLSAQSIVPALLLQESLQCAAESNGCYYFEDLVSVQNQTEIDLTVFAPPGLAIEIVLLKTSSKKLSEYEIPSIFSIYAALGIPEVWCYVGVIGEQLLQGKLLMYYLQADHYIERPRSLNFPFLSGDQVVEFLEQSDSIGLAKSLRVLRQWIQENGEFR